MRVVKTTLPRSLPHVDDSADADRRHLADAYSTSAAPGAAKSLDSRGSDVL